MNNPDIATILDRWTYNPNTGQFTFRRRSSWKNVGDIAGARHCDGYVTPAEEAHERYKQEAARLFGDFACVDRESPYVREPRHVAA